MGLPQFDYRFRPRTKDQPKKTEPLLPHQQRVIDEVRELDVKRDKLHAFIGRDDFINIVPLEKERQRLYRQSSIMAEYSKVLHERITAFGGEA